MARIFFCSFLGGTGWHGLFFLKGGTTSFHRASAKQEGLILQCTDY